MLGKAAAALPSKALLPSPAPHQTWGESPGLAAGSLNYSAVSPHGVSLSGFMARKR